MDFVQDYIKMELTSVELLPIGIELAHLEYILEQYP